MALPSKIALRFLKSNKWQTLLIIVGIAIGVSIQIFIGVLITSLQKQIVGSVVGDSSQITVVSDLDNNIQIEGYDDMIDEIEKFDEISAVSVAQDSSALTNASSKNTPLFVRGFDLDEAEDIYELDDKLEDGDLPEDANEVIIGEELGEELKLEIDDYFYIQVAAKSINAYVKVVGIFNFGVKSINELWVITNLKTAQNIFANGNNTITSIETQLYEDYLFEADLIAEEIEDEIDDDDIDVKNWISQNEQLQDGLQGQSLSSYFIQSFAIISVVIGISSVLSITVLQKSRQLGILKAMGITNRDASKIFLYEGLFFGILGALGGIAFGLFLLFGFSLGSGVVQIVIDPIFLVLSAAIVVGSAVIASLSPAIKSSRLDPIDIIRGE